MDGIVSPSGKVSAEPLAASDRPKELPSTMTIQVADGCLRFGDAGKEVAIDLAVFAKPMTITKFNALYVTPSALALTLAHQGEAGWMA